MPNQEKTIQLPIAWIKRMKEIAENVKAVDGYPVEAERLNLLLGYLSSLDMYLDEE